MSIQTHVHPLSRHDHSEHLLALDGVQFSLRSFPANKHFCKCGKDVGRNHVFIPEDHLDPLQAFLDLRSISNFEFRRYENILKVI